MYRRCHVHKFQSVAFFDCVVAASAADADADAVVPFHITVFFCWFPVALFDSFVLIPFESAAVNYSAFNRFIIYIYFK